MIQKFEFQSMGSRILVAIDSKVQVPKAVFQLVPDWFRHWENVFSRFDPQSELSRLNRSEGIPFKASPEMMEVLALARDMRELSAGIVTPTVLDALISSGYDADFSSLFDEKRNASSNWPAFPPDALDFELDAITHKVRLAKGTHIDLGGFAKGWAAHKAMMRLLQYGAVLVNAGGDIALSGPLENGEPWLIGVENPLEVAQNTALVNLWQGGIATSGKDYRHWMKDGKLMHHLIHPWTGMPAVSDVFSATVIARDVMLAETAAKVAVISGSQRGCEWMDSQPGMAYLLQLDDGQVVSNLLFNHYLWKEHEHINA